MWNYDNHEHALTDALRLSRGMTYKSAISGLNLGGGKAVLIGDAHKLKSEAYWRRYGKFVNSLNGKYITAEDVNTSSSDMEYIGMETEFVTGMPDYMGGSGDPSPLTAYGVYVGMKAAAKKHWGKDSLTGKKILVQGAGNVGQYLMGYLVEEGAKVLVCDISEPKLKQAKEKYPAIEVIPNTDIFSHDIDIYAPCALGATVNTESINKMKCPVIAGAGGALVPDLRGGRVGIGAPADLQTAADQVHRPRMAALGGPPIPGQRLHAVEGDAPAVEQHVGVVVLAPIVAGLGRAAIPGAGFMIVGRRAPAVLVAAADHVHGLAVAGLGRPPEPAQRGGRILLHPLALQQHPAEPQLGLRHPVDGGGANPRRRPAGIAQHR